LTSHLATLLEQVRKDGPVAADTHVSSAGGSTPRKKKKPASDDDSALPVTNMTLAAQVTTGQKDTAKYAEVLKVDESLGLVLGWAIVCKKDGKDYFDLQDDHIPEDAMLKASADFMDGARVAKEMHQGDAKGTVLFAFPLTEDIAKAFGLETKTTGLMIAVKPHDKETLEKFRNKEYTGFSIGGYRIADEDA
jgi:hypothetical protein